MKLRFAKNAEQYILVDTKTNEIVRGTGGRFTFDSARGAKSSMMASCTLFNNAAYEWFIDRVDPQDRDLIEQSIHKDVSDYHTFVALHPTVMYIMEGKRVLYSEEEHTEIDVRGHLHRKYDSLVQQSRKINFAAQNRYVVKMINEVEV